MSTKTNLECAANSYSAGTTYIGTMGRDSPGALLDMLAEVASRTLHSEKKESQPMRTSKCKPKVEIVKRKMQESAFTLPQLLAMPPSQLVKQFSHFTCDELKKQYSYTCALLPECEQKYTSFASEGKARLSIKAHLAEHLRNLNADTQAYSNFTATSVKHKKCKTNLQNKKARLQQSKKPQELPNKENKNVTQEKSTNYLRKILLNDMSFKDFEKQKTVQKSNGLKDIQTEVKDTSTVNYKVLGDHSYYEHLKEEMPHISPVNDAFVDSTTEENIVLMVVGADSVHMKEYPQINNKPSNQLEHTKQDSVYLSDIGWQEETCDKNMEVTTIAKPKGKAKFIGTSMEEREMALAFIDRIKKKGNPTGSNLQCRICDPPRTFTAPTTLVSHYRSHAGIKPYECRICRAVFTRRHSLKYHMLIHQNQTRFTCADCGKKFRHPSHFREHRRRHTGEAPFGCDDCGQRFKTRNTYKRHLKTRHGKVLTTTGELLCLSEEDFQKVRTNRKKRTDTDNFTTENALNEDAIAPNAIMQYESTHNQQLVDDNINVEHVICSNNDDDNSVWEAKDVIKIMKDEGFENYEICSQSHTDKTEYIETEIPVDSNHFIKNGDENEDGSPNETQSDTAPVENVIYDHIKILQDENGQILCHEDIENQNHTVYSDTRQIQSYLSSEENSVENEGECILEYDENINFEEHENNSNLQVNEDTYCTNALNEENHEEEGAYVLDMERKQVEIVTENSNGNENILTEENNTGIIIPQDCIVYKGSGKFIRVFEEKLPEDAEHIKADFSVKTELLQDNSELQILNDTTDDNLSQYKNEYNQAYEQEIDCETFSCTLSCPKEEKDEENQLQDAIQNLYDSTGTLNNPVVLNECVGILPQQLSLSQQNSTKMQLTDCKRVTLLNKQARTLNLLSNGKQGTILLVSPDSLKNGILRIDQNSIVINGINEQTVAASK